MLKIKNIMCMVLATLLMLAPVSSSYASIDNDPIETQRQMELDNVYSQLENQGKENMFYLFEHEINQKYDAMLSENEDGQEVFNTRYFTFRNGGTVRYISSLDTQTEFEQIYFNERETSELARKQKAGYNPGIAEYIIGFSTSAHIGAWLAIYDAINWVRDLNSSWTWRQINDRNGTRRATIMTANSPHEGKATVLSYWSNAPSVVIGNVYRLERAQMR